MLVVLKINRVYVFFSLRLCESVQSVLTLARFYDDACSAAESTAESRPSGTFHHSICVRVKGRNIKIDTCECSTVYMLRNNAPIIITLPLRN